MKNFKEFYKRNRVYSILMLVSLVCIVSILVGVIVYFVGQTTKDKYGNRLDGIDNVKITDTKKSEVENKIKENELVDSVKINIKGKLIYVNIELKTGKHSDSEAICQSALENFSEDEKKFYDIQYIVTNKDTSIEENFTVMGYIKAGNSVIKWTNYVQ